MKRSVILIIFASYISGQNFINSQGITYRETIDSINVILKNNPYIDRFNEISFYYSVDITEDKELKVEMTFDGPFKWVYKAKIADLDISPRNDVCRESTGTLCWTCKQSGPNQANSCVQTEMILADGSSQKENSGNICISFSGQGGICSDLYKKLQFLLSKVMNDSK